MKYVILNLFLRSDRLTTSYDCIDLSFNKANGIEIRSLVLKKRSYLLGVNKRYYLYKNAIYETRLFEDGGYYVFK